MEKIGELTEYYEGREEFKLASNSSANHLVPAKNMVFGYWNQEKFDNPELERAKSLTISLDSMIGYQETRKDGLKRLYEEAAKLASDFFKREYLSRDISKINLKVNGSSLPLEVILEKDGEEKAIFIKSFDINRLIGIELYSLISGTEHYNYAFNEDYIIEEKMRGKHEFEFIPGEFLKVKKMDNYIRNKVKLDLVSIYMGLDDLSKKDNYLITDGGTINVIDFDVMDRVYTSEDLENIRKGTCKELEITSEEYDKIYRFEEFLLKRRLQNKKDNILKLINIAKNMDQYNNSFNFIVRSYDEGEKQHD